MPFLTQSQRGLYLQKNNTLKKTRQCNIWHVFCITYSPLKWYYKLYAAPYATIQEWGHWNCISVWRMSKAMKKAKNSKHMYVWTHDTPHSCMVSYSVLDFFLYIQLYLFHINIVLFWFGLPWLSRTRVTLTKEIAKESFKCTHIIYSPCLETFWKILTQLPSAPQKSPGIVIGIKSWLPF